MVRLTKMDTIQYNINCYGYNFKELNLLLFRSVWYVMDAARNNAEPTLGGGGANP